MNVAVDPAAEALRGLLDAVARVRARIAASVAGEEVPANAERELSYACPPLERLSEAFSLTRFERDLVLMCAAAELEADFPATPSFALGLAALARPHWSALSQHGALRRMRVLLLGEGRPLAEAPLRIAEPVLHYLLGGPCLDACLAERLRVVAAPVALPESQLQAAATAADRIARGVMVHLVGPAAEVDAVAAHVASRQGLACLALDPSLPGLPDDWLTSWRRDALLSPALLLIDGGGCDEAKLRALAAQLREVEVPIVFATAQPAALPGLAASPIALGKPTSGEQAALWRVALAQPDGDPAIDRAVNHFDLDSATIAAVATATGGDADAIWRECRARTADAGGFAMRVVPVAGWRDIALPAACEAALRDMVAQVRNRRLVQDDWGFLRGSERGRGVTALFHGPSGTGKSLAAEVVAHALDLDLHLVDLSRVVSKYIGETEQRLSAVFDAGEASGAVLLFDEADALFGARSEVRDSHDRYANMEVSYLLQRMERYRGLAILTTNMRDAIDTAFLRRIRFVVEFAHPGPAERERLWRAAFPAGAPLGSVDPLRLAQANLTGAQIRAVALAAGFLAAEAGTAIDMAHLLQAARSECAKMQRPLTQAEAAGWL